MKEGTSSIMLGICVGILISFWIAVMFDIFDTYKSVSQVIEDCEGRNPHTSYCMPVYYAIPVD